MALTLTAVQAVALSYEQARGQIEQALTIEMRRTAVKEETGKLRQQAKIEYEGRFAASAPSSAQVQGISPAPSAATAASAPMQASSTAAGPSSAASAASSAASALDADMLRRGLGK